MTDSRKVADFLGEDGCLRCGVCGKRKQLRYQFYGKGPCSGLPLRLRGSGKER